MFVFKLKISKDRFLIICCALIAVMALVVHFFAFGKVLPRGNTFSERGEFLRELGYTAQKSTEKETEVIIPINFDKVYTSYNEMQRCADFDLSGYRGCQAVMYTYDLSNFYKYQEVKANLLVIRGRIIGGDITTREQDGFCLPLVSLEENIKSIKEN